MKIYTKTGDRGETTLVGGARVPKTHPRLDAYGTLDELNSVLGLLRSEIGSQASTTAAQKSLEMVQNNLFNIGSHLACEDSALATKLPPLSPGAIQALENDMDGWETALPELKTFILPGGVRAASISHIARSVCRRAEREILHLQNSLAREGSASAPEIDPQHLIFLNRLSDWLFVFARSLNSAAGVGDVLWRKG